MGSCSKRDDYTDMMLKVANITHYHSVDGPDGHVLIGEKKSIHRIWRYGHGN